MKLITIVTTAAYNQIPPTQTMYSLYKTEKIRSFDLLRFTDHIPNAEALIAVVDKYVRQHNITVLDRRGKTEVRQNHL